MVIRLGPGAEFDLIRRFIAGSPEAPRAVRVGVGDDCAVIDADGLAVTVDMAIEGVHFRREWLEPVEIGYRAAAGALSDLAAVAARPIAVLASLGLAPGDEAGPGEEVERGIAEAARAVGAVVVGGDVVRSPGPLVIDVVAVGESRAPVLRSGARPGGEVWVTGELGAAAAAVRSWAAGETPAPAARQAFARPRPRTWEARWLAQQQVPTAMIDISDGLAGDAAHIAAASRVRLVLDGAAIPIAEPARGEDALRLAAAGGEDYELCFTARPGTVEARRAEFVDRFGIPLTRVGRVEEGEGAVVLDREGRPVRLEAFQHWRASA